MVQGQTAYHIYTYDSIVIKYTHISGRPLMPMLQILNNTRVSFLTCHLITVLFNNAYFVLYCAMVSHCNGHVKKKKDKSHENPVEEDGIMNHDSGS